MRINKDYSNKKLNILAFILSNFHITTYIIMKKIISLCLLMSSIIVSQAQSTIDTFRKVATKGYAEREVTPDIIFISISLKEFYLDGNLRKKVFIETLEKQLHDAAMSIGVKQEDFTIQNIYSYNYEIKKKNTELLQARQYRIKVTNLNRLNEMMDKIDPKGIQNTSINGYDHSNKREIEKELKTAAVRDARQNAEILAAADGQAVGKALVINDNSNINFNDLMPVNRMYKTMAMSDGIVGAESAENVINIDIKPIKVTCYIDAAFELK